MTLPPFSEPTLAALRKIVPAFGSPENPADITAGFFNDMRLFTDALEIVLADPGLDQLSILLASISGASAGKACEAIADVAKRTDKPVHVAWSGRQAKSPEALKALTDAGVPFITTPVRLARAAAVLARFAADRRRLLPRKAPKVAMPQGARAAGRRRDAERGGKQGGAAGLRHSRSPRRCSLPRERTRPLRPRACKRRSPSRSSRATSPTRRKPAASSSASRRTAWPKRCAPSRPTPQGRARRQDRRRARLRDGAGHRGADRRHQR